MENAGFGAAAAAPIARRVLDYLLADLYPSEEDIAAVQQGKAGAPIGTPRKASEVPLPRGRDAFAMDTPLSGPQPAASAASAASAPASAPVAATPPRPSAPASTP